MLFSLFAFAMTPQTSGLPPPAANPPRSVRAPDKLPPANPLAPPDGSEERAVLATIDWAFAALAAGDRAALLAEFASGGRVTEMQGPIAATMDSADFVARIPWGQAKLEERISDAAVEIDGAIAMVWAPYVFRVNGKVDHCGTDHFDLIRVNGAWKILNLTGSRRTTGCPA